MTAGIYSSFDLSHLIYKRVVLKGHFEEQKSGFIMKQERA